MNDPCHVYQRSDQETGHTSGKKAGSKNSANPAATVRQCRGNHFQEYKPYHIQNQYESIIPEIEEIGIIQLRIGIIRQQIA